MKANEFIKKFGIFGAKEYLAGATFFDEHLMVFTDTKELKLLIESHELVEQYNGLFEAKELIRVSPKMTIELRELDAAIEDVESCL